MFPDALTAVGLCDYNFGALQVDGLVAAALTAAEGEALTCVAR